MGTKSNAGTTSAPAGYSGTPLPKKLAIKPGSIVGLVNAPREFRTTLGDVPEGVRFTRKCVKDGMTLWFVKSASDYRKRIRQISLEIGGGRLWIIWPKLASGVTTDLSQNLVRESALANNLVDYKVCAVDHTWSGLLFKRRD